MNKDLTSPLIEARRKASIWPETAFWRFLNRINRRLDQTNIDFDFDSGVCWATIQKNDPKTSYEAVGFVRFDAPLVIILEEIAAQVEDILAFYDLVVIRVPDWEEKCYSIDPSKIPEIFPNNVWTPEIDPNCLSIGDLWFTTIT